MGASTAEDWHVLANQQVGVGSCSCVSSSPHCTNWLLVRLGAVPACLLWPNNTYSTWELPCAGVNGLCVSYTAAQLSLFSAGRGAAAAAPTRLYGQPACATLAAQPTAVMAGHMCRAHTAVRCSRRSNRSRGSSRNSRHRNGDPLHSNIMSSQHPTPTYITCS
jgi:hypothetical protein